MSVTKVKSIESIDQQINQLDKLRNCGDLIAAGLTISVRMGPSADDDDSKTSKTTVIETSHHTQELLELMIKSLKESRKFWVTMARQDAKKLNEFLASEDLKAS